MDPFLDTFPVQPCALYTRRGPTRRIWGLGNSLRGSWTRIQPGRMKIRDLREYTIKTTTGGILIIYASTGRGTPGARPARFRHGQFIHSFARFPWCLPRDGPRILSAQGCTKRWPQPASAGAPVPGDGLPGAAVGVAAADREGEGGAGSSARSSRTSPSNGARATRGCPWCCRSIGATTRHGATCRPGCSVATSTSTGRCTGWCTRAGRWTARRARAGRSTAQGCF